MNTRIKAAFLAISLAVLAGCSSTPIDLDRKALAANKVNTIDLTSAKKITYTRSEGASRATSMLGGGLVGALVGMGVDGAINMNRASTIAPIIKAMGNYNTSDVFKRKLAGLKGPSFANGLKVNSYETPVESELNVLNIASGYVLSANHQAVGVGATAKIKTSEKAPVYAKRYSASSPIQMGLKEGEKINATRWLTKNPAKLKQAIESAMDKIVQQIAVDYNVGTPKQ